MLVPSIVTVIATATVLAALYVVIRTLDLSALLLSVISASAAALCISPGQHSGGATGVSRQCLGAPGWLKQRYDGLGKYRPSFDIEGQGEEFVVVCILILDPAIPALRR